MADKVLDLLNGMGDTPDEIAAFLEGQGIKGWQGSEMDCPVAEYLKVCGYVMPVVSIRNVIPIDGSSVFTPHSVRSFIKQFDAGHYPNISKGEMPRD